MVFQKISDNKYNILSYFSPPIKRIIAHVLIKNLNLKIFLYNFINDLFKELEIDLLRYPIYNTYYKDTLKKRITENIKEHYYED